VRIPAAGRWQLNDQPEPTPTGQILAVEGRDDFRLGRVVPPEEAWDDLFTDLATEEGASTCWIEEDRAVLFADGSERALTLRRWVRLAQSEEPGSRPIPHLQLYTPKGRAAISLEPLSAPPDALNLLARGHRKASVWECRPGESAAFEIVLGITRLA
jgi:galactose mutarotase-like enzyme